MLEQEKHKVTLYRIKRSDFIVKEMVDKQQNRKQNNNNVIVHIIKLSCVSFWSEDEKYVNKKSLNVIL